METDVTHPLSGLAFVSPPMLEWFQGNWIETLEEAVAALSCCPVAFPDREAFFEEARKILGEETFQRLATPLPPHPAGLLFPEKEDVVSADAPKPGEPPDAQPAPAAAGDGSAAEIPAEYAPGTVPPETADTGARDTETAESASTEGGTDDQAQQ